MSPIHPSTLPQANIDSPHFEDFWAVVLGSSYCATVDALRPELLATVQDRLLRARRAGATTIRTDIVLGTAARS
ncbi:MAG: hypothetical protein ACXVUL_23250 [Solirubrobacteraceae bacterium]